MTDEFLETDQINILIMATSFCGKYDEWKDNPDIINVLNMNSNSFCKTLKIKYPDAEDKVIQSISLAYLMTLFMICNDTHIETVSIH
jgi:hypothetical protein